MGYMKTFDIRIRNGGDDAIQAVTELIDMERHNTAIRVGMECRRWIPAEERLPEPDYMGNPVGVLACLPDGERCIAFCDNDEYGVRWQCNSTQKPTHWMPLPEPPAS